METRFYDPTSAETGPPFTAVFNDYVRRELNYKTDMPYYTTAYTVWGPSARWDWGSSQAGFPDTASALRAAIVKNPYLKVRVLEGYYDLATPYSQPITPWTISISIAATATTFRTRPSTPATWSTSTRLRATR